MIKPVYESQLKMVQIVYRSFFFLVFDFLSLIPKLSHNVFSFFTLLHKLNSSYLPASKNEKKKLSLEKNTLVFRSLNKADLQILVYTSDPPRRQKLLLPSFNKDGFSFFVVLVTLGMSRFLETLEKLRILYKVQSCFQVTFDA